MGHVTRQDPGGAQRWQSVRRIGEEVSGEPDRVGDGRVVTGVALALVVFLNDSHCDAARIVRRQLA